MPSSSTKETADMNFRVYVDSIHIPLNEIESATNYFAPKNLIARGSYANVYKGQLLESGDNIVARKCVNLKVNLVVNEVEMYKDLKHKNIASLFKLVNTEDQAFTIHKHETNESLDKHLGDSTLTWMQRLRICIGVARALQYLHFGLKDDDSVIHGNIKSSKILLDDNWEPKLHDFRCAVKVKRHNLYITSNYNGTPQYKDPAFEGTGGLTHKSDVFSFGVVLFEVLLGRKASIPDKPVSSFVVALFEALCGRKVSVSDKDIWYFANLAKLHYEDKSLDAKIDSVLRGQMDDESLNIFSETAYCCLKEQRAERPDMDQIVNQLERALQLQQKHQSPINSPAAVEGSTSSIIKGESMDNLKVPLSEIKEATDNFSEKYLKGLGGYGTVYVAKLQRFDGIGPVAIKRTNKRRDKETEISFMAEIDMLIKAKHENVVSLLGFCDEFDEMILICEYASNESLAKYLGNGSMKNFTWTERLKICLDIANGLHHLHNGLQGANTIIHCDIKSDNILLDYKWVAKIADFGLSKLHQEDKGSTLQTKKVAGTKFYRDPEYEKSGKLKKKSDIYSFGVVLFEILRGKLAYNKAFGEKGIAAKARQCYKDNTLKQLVDPKIMEAVENHFALNGGVSQASIDTFSNIAHNCVAESQDNRPTIEKVIEELKKALRYQKNYKDSLHISLKDIKSATKKFREIVGEGRHWKQYKGESTDGNKTSIMVKRWDSNSAECRQQFLTELQILYQNKHENIISLFGYCNEEGEHIIVYQNEPNRSLDQHLINASLTWIRRLKICIDVAKGLEFLHTSVSMMHRDIKSSSILLDSDWKAKISNFELSTPLSDKKPIEHVTDDNAYRSLSYVSENDQKEGYLTRESDIYSLGVVLKEVLWGRLTDPTDRGSHHVVENGKEILYGLLLLEGMKEQIDGKSKRTFEDIAGLCLAYKKHRPRVTEVITKLEKALNLQISSMAKMYESPEMKKDLDDVFSKGILLKDDKVWLSLGSNGERIEKISARNFLYKNHSSLKWRSGKLVGSRFPKVAEIIDISNLKIQIKIRTQFISPSVNHKVHLIFRFWGPIKSQAKRMYVNLKYKMGNETLHAYFATWREDGWMMIELFQSLDHKEDTDFEVRLESMSRGYCGNSSIYIEGIEFQAVENVSHEDSERLKEVQNVLIENSNMDKEEKEEIMLSAKKVVRTNSSSMGRYLGREKLGENMYGAAMYKSHQIHQDSIIFSGAIEFKRHQLFRIRYKIQRQILSPDTKNACYLVFKLSEKCRGLHSPVLVRDLSHRKKRSPHARSLHDSDWIKKNRGILYFRSPHPRSLHDGDWIPKKRSDGWMEVILWIFNSGNKIKYDHLYVDLKLTTYEGTMSGLIVRGIEFHPI